MAVLHVDSQVRCFRCYPTSLVVFLLLVIVTALSLRLAMRSLGLPVRSLVVSMVGSYGCARTKVRPAILLGTLAREVGR